MLVEFTYKREIIHLFFQLENLREINFENEKKYIGTETLVDVSLCSKT